MGFYNEKRAADPKWTAGDEVHDRALAACGVAVEAASRVQPFATRWLVRNVVPDETVTIVAGAAGVGKTFFACQLAADTAHRARPENRVCRRRRAELRTFGKTRGVCRRELRILGKT